MQQPVGPPLRPAGRRTLLGSKQTWSRWPFGLSQASQFRRRPLRHPVLRQRSHETCRQGPRWWRSHRGRRAARSGRPQTLAAFTLGARAPLTEGVSSTSGSAAGVRFPATANWRTRPSQSWGGWVPTQRCGPLKTLAEEFTVRRPCAVKQSGRQRWCPSGGLWQKTCTLNASSRAVPAWLSLVENYVVPNAVNVQA